MFAASFCLQTHISYAGLGAGLTGLTALWVALVVCAALADRERARGRCSAGSAVSAGLGVLLWLPPVIQQLTGEHGNLRILYDHFTDPPEEAVGLGTGMRVMLVHLNPWRLVSGTGRDAGRDGARRAVRARLGRRRGRSRGGSKVRGARSGSTSSSASRSLLAFISASRIFGFLWFYLVLWSWSITVLMLVGIGWAIALRSSTARSRTRVDGPRGASVVAVVSVVLVVALASFTVESARRGVAGRRALGDAA